MMRNWLTYLLEANLYFAAAYGAYWLLLRKQTFYSANRAYLLLGAVLSFAMPLMQFELSVSSTESPSVAAHQTYQTLTYVNPTAAASNREPALMLNKALESIFFIGAVVLFVLLFLKLYSLLKLIFSNQRQKQSGYTLVLIPNLPSPFSFLGYLFAADEQDLTPAILRHELVHIRQNHSWDILFFELVKTVSWFNPVIYLAQNSLKTLHEYEADYASANDDSNPDKYVQVLIAKAYQVNGLPFANHFSNKQLLKSRIMKLYQKRSGKLARLTYLITLPLCAGMLCASTMAFSKTYGLVKFKLGRQPEITSTTLPDDTQPDKKQRLKITSGTMTSVTDKLEIRGGNGKPLIFTAANLTAENKKMLANWGMIVETTNAKATTTSLVLPPPPPPVPGTSAIKLKQKTPHPILLPPPPPTTPRRQSAEAHAAETQAKNQPETVAKSQFADMLKRVASTIRYPQIAKENDITGMVVATFRVNQNKKISDVKIEKGISSELDAETIRSISAYDETLTVKPGIYSMGINFNIEYADGSKTKKPITIEKVTAGIITTFGYRN